MITFCFQGEYYVQRLQLEDDDAGDEVAGLLHHHRDPAKWRELLQAATFIKYPDDPFQTPPSDELIEALRQTILFDEEYACLRENWIQGMTRENLRDSDDRPELEPEMESILEDPASFLSFCRLQVLSHFNNTWEWFCCQLANSYRKYFLLFLDQGFFVYSEGPLSNAPGDSCFIINVDIGLCRVSLEDPPGTKVFEMGRFPLYNWLHYVEIPGSLVELALAYTPEVKKMVVEEMNRSLLWQLELDVIAAPDCKGFRECLELLEILQSYLYGFDLSPQDARKKDDLKRGGNEDELLGHRGLLALMLALLPFRDKIRWAFNENTVSRECFRKLSTLAKSGVLEKRLPANTELEDFRKRVMDSAKVKFREIRLNKFLNSG